MQTHCTRLLLAAALAVSLTAAACQPTPQAAPPAVSRGYVNDSSLSTFIPASHFANSAGTWTISLATNVVSLNRTAADAAFNTAVPVDLPASATAQHGTYLTSVDVWYSIGTAAADDFATVEMELETLSATGITTTASAPSVTVDAAHDTAAERKAVGEHKMTVTLATPAWIDNDTHYTLWLVVDAAATTVVKWYGARANYTLRL
jgi:hypothetical protein